MKVNIKTRKNILIGIILSILFLLFLTSLIADNCFKNYLNDVFKWISGLSSLITLTIALLLFDKYGLNKKIRDKKQDVVLELLNELSNSTLLIETNIGKDSSIRRPYSLVSGAKFKTEDFVGKELIFSENYASGIDQIFKFSKNYWLPNTIIDQLSKACSYTLLFKEFDPFDPKYIRIKFSMKIDYHNDKTIKYGIMKLAKNLTVENYFQAWSDLHDSIIKWLNENADFKIDKE